MLRAAVFLSITGVIQQSQQTFLFCHDGYTDPDIWMYQVLPRGVAHINNSIIISFVAKFMNWKLTLASVLDKSGVTWLVTLWYFIHLIGQI